MKKFLIGITFIIVIISATMGISAKEIKVSKTHFPNSEFRTVLLNSVDTNKDGILSEKEQKKKKSLFLDNVNNIKGISKLEYIEHVQIHHSTMSKIKNVNEFYQMKKLREISFTECNIGTFNPKKIKKLNTLSYHSVRAKVKNYDFRNNKQIKKISLISANINSLKIKGVTNLAYLEIVGSPQIKKIDLSEFKKLEYLELWNIPLMELDVSKNTRLKNLGIGGTGIKELDLRKNKKLERIDIYENRAEQTEKKVNVLTNKVKIDNTNFPDKYIRKVINENVDINMDRVLQQVEMGQLESLTLDDKKNMGKKINFKGLENFKNIKKLTIKSTSGVEIRNFKKIYQLNDLTKLTLKGLTNLKTISPAKFKMLKYIELYNTATKKLDVSKNKKLTAVVFKAKKMIKKGKAVLILRKHPNKYYTYGVSKKVKVIIKNNK